MTERVTLAYGVDETRPIVDLQQTPSPRVTSIGSKLLGHKWRQAEDESVGAEASQILAQELSGSGRTRCQSSAQAAAGVNSEPTISNNQVDSRMMSGKSSSQPASEVQHHKPSCTKTASPNTVSQAQSEDATQVYSKRFPQHASQSGDEAIMHDMPTHRMTQMEAEKIGQGSAQVTAEVEAEAASSQKPEVTVPTPSQGRSQPVSRKRKQGASPGDNPSPQVTCQSSAQATTADKRYDDATSALPEPFSEFPWCQWRRKPAAAAEACNARVSPRRSFRWRVLRRQCETQRLVTRLYRCRVERPRRRHVVAIKQCD